MLLDESAKIDPGWCAGRAGVNNGAGVSLGANVNVGAGVGVRTVRVRVCVCVRGFWVAALAHISYLRL